MRYLVSWTGVQVRKEATQRCVAAVVVPKGPAHSELSRLPTNQMLARSRCRYDSWHKDKTTVGSFHDILLKHQRCNRGKEPSAVVTPALTLRKGTAH